MAIDFVDFPMENSGDCPGQLCSPEDSVTCCRGMRSMLRHRTIGHTQSYQSDGQQMGVFRLTPKR